MSQFIHLDPDARAWCRRHGSDLEEAKDDFWPEVSSEYEPQDPPSIDEENTQGRVLSEVFLILAAAAALVAVVTMFLPNGALTH